MHDRSPSPHAFHTLIELAERIEQASCTCAPIGPMLTELRDALATCERSTTWLRSDRPDPFARMYRVIDQLRRDAAGGRVRSISGLTHEARRLTLALDVSAPAKV